MGTRVDKSGLSVQLYDKNTKPMGKPIFGRYVEFRGLPRTKVITPKNPATSQEFAEPGSDDWMTLIAVADTSEGLKKILRGYSGTESIPQTSAASHRALIEIDVDGKRDSLKDRIIIASGAIMATPKPSTTPIMSVVHVKVLADGATMDDDNPLIDEFRGMVKFR